MMFYRNSILYEYDSLLYRFNSVESSSVRPRLRALKCLSDERKTLILEQIELELGEIIYTITGLQIIDSKFSFHNKQFMFSK